LSALVTIVAALALVAISDAARPAARAAADAPAAPNNADYAIVDASGGVMTFGGAGYYGDTLASALTKPIVGSTADPHGGYWLVASDGGVFTFGSAGFWGSTGNLALNKPIVGMAATPDGNGYWLVASDGGVFAFGDAGFWGSTGNIVLNKPIVGMAATPSGNGYWLVASDGGVFAFGDAGFWGSTGNIVLNKPIVGMARTPSGAGYWMVATDGGIFAFGDAGFWGSTGNLVLNKPIVGMSPTPSGNGYWLVAADAGIFTFGDALFSGTATSPLHPPGYPAVLSVPIPPVVSIMNVTPGPQATHTGTERVAFLGDSIGLYEAQYTMQNNAPYEIDDGAAPGCGFTDGEPLLQWSAPATVYLSPPACTAWSNQLQWVESRFHPDVTVLQVGYWEVQYRQWQGAYTTIQDPNYAAYIQANLEQAVQIAHSEGGDVILATAPYDDDGTPNSLVDDFNQIVQNVVAATPSYVSEFDLFSLLDPNGGYSSVVDGVVARGADGVHITQACVDDIIDPALNQLIGNLAPSVYGDGA
jgi:hypothetical protein